MIERRRKLADEIAILDRMIEQKALHLEQEAEVKHQLESKDWTARYKGQAGLILSAIWNAPHRRMTSTKICTIVWQDGAKPQETFSKAIKRLRKRLREASCPYRLVAIKCRKTNAVKGYSLQKIQR